MKTEFASPERASEEKLNSEVETTGKLPLVRELTYIIPDAFVILNTHRQIVYCNSTLLAILGLERPDAILGLRLGEALQCIHSNESEGGCGTTKYCKQCGAVNAMVKSQAAPGEMKEEQCRLTSGDEEHSFEFQIRAKTLEISGSLFTLVIARDASHEKRREALERIFFHDILNTAGGIQGLIEMMTDASKEEMAEYLSLANTSSETLVEEIMAQRELLAAERGELQIDPSRVNTLEILESVVCVYTKHEVCNGKSVIVAESSESVDFLSDPGLLIRVVGNMVKNALEAEQNGAIITIGSKKNQEQIEFWVQNPSVMPEEIALQIFQRSFSTKGTGRGLGTYSIKLLGEKFLNGDVEFTSKQGEGTIFSICLPLEG